jgi:tetratricopeptide (TPR) repeat protein/serine/threonine protein kinase
LIDDSEIKSVSAELKRIILAPTKAQLYAVEIPENLATSSRFLEDREMHGNKALGASADSTRTDRNLLFGLIALQTNFITREQLVAAFDAWVQDKSLTVAEILERQGALPTAEREVMEKLVGMFLEKHGGDAQKSLAALSSVPDLRPDLAHLNAPELANSLKHAGGSPPPDSESPSTIAQTGDSARGRFQILRLHAKGGLGLVSVAVDQDLNREVALKEIQRHHADDRVSRERFVLEAEITGGLEHPGIVPVYALGHGPDGRPFYAMRFVKGDSLKRAIEAFHKPDNPNRNDPGARQIALRQLLRRFIDVCNAIEYAHSRGVLHRDLKPGNIMVGKYGETLVVDWGLAKIGGIKENVTDEPALLPASALSSSGQTHPGSAIGTPAYMSPEQAAGNLEELGPASDVYSLGATLYHLLCGRPAFEKEELEDILAKVKRGDFAKPRSIEPEVPPALEAICLKAMTLNPSDRYSKPRILSDDLEQWLAGEAVSCYSDPLWTRLDRFYRHHRRKMNIAVLCLVAFFVAGASWTFAAFWNSSQRDRLEQVRVEAVPFITSGEEALSKRQFERAINQFAGARAIVEKRPELVDMRDRVDVSLQICRREQSRVQAEQLVAGSGDALSKGQFEDAARQLTDARTILENRPELAELHNRVNRSLTSVQAQLRLNTFRSMAGDAEEQILGGLWTLLPHEDPEGRHRITRTSEKSPNLETGIVRAKEALGLYDLPADTTPSREPSDLTPEQASQLRSRVAEILFLFALAEERIGQAPPATRHTEALETACRLLDIAEELDNRTESLYRYRAKFRDLLGRAADAAADRRNAEQTPLKTFLDHHLKGVELLREQKNPAKAATEYQIAVAARPNDFWTLYRLAKTLEALGKRPEAEAQFRNILGLRPDDATTRNSLGTLLSDQRKNEEAIAEFEAVISTNPDYILAYGNMMKAQGNLKQVDAAESTFARLMNREPGAIEQARAWDFLGMAYELAGQDEKALAKYDEALRLDPENPGIVRNRSLCRVRLGRYVELLDDIERAISLNPEDGELQYVKGNYFANWGRAKAAQAEAPGRIEQAISAYQEAVALGYVSARYNRGVLLRQLRRFEDAMQDQNDILEGTPDNALALYERALNLLNLKRFQDAIDDLGRILSLDTLEAQELRVDVYRTRGKAWGDLGALELSESELSRAIELAPVEPDGYRSRGLTRMRRGRIESGTPENPENWRGAIADYRKYLELRPTALDAASILNDLNEAYLGLGQFDEAIAVLDQAIKLNPKPPFLANRGNVRLMRGELQRAVEDFGEALRLDPKYTRAWALRGQARLRQGQFDDATTDLDRALELEPGFYETLLLRAIANLGGERVDAARRDLEQVARDRPDHIRGKFARGLIAYLDKRFGEAIADLSSGFGDPVLLPFGLPYRARVFLGLGPQGSMSAVGDADELVRIRPTDGWALLEAARIHAAAALPDGRERIFELLNDAIKQDPELRARLASDPDLKLLKSDPRFPK